MFKQNNITKSIKHKRFFLPLFWKFSLAIFLIIMMFGFINAYLTWTNVYSNLQEESENKGLFISKFLAEESVDFLLYEDFVGLQKLLERSLELNSSIYYLFILDEKYQPVVHTFEYSIPIDLIRFAKEADPYKVDISLFEVKNSPGSIIRNISVPILDGKLGTLHIGILESKIIKKVKKTVNLFWLMVILFMMVGFLGAFAFTNFITAPIKKIQETTSKLDFSALEFRTLGKISIRQKFLNRFPLLFRAYDEIDLLVEHINDMIERLENAYSNLHKANEKLLHSEKMASIGEITAGLAHEINNPIAGINYCIKRARMKLSDAKQQEKYLALIEDAIGRIEKVVKELLDFCRKKNINIVSVNLSSVIEHAIILVSYKLEQFQISINNNITPDAPNVIAAKDRLTQVIINLLLNSIDAIVEKMQNGDEEYYQGSISFDYHLEDQFLVLKISDDGIGIDEESLEKVFDPFFTSKSVGKGTGLGLAVSYNIIQAIDGKIEIKSKKGEGTTVLIYLKIADSEEKQ